ncbi:MAG: ribbon-helix-helix protein, CopG family [Acidobacteriota bacterium]|nr:ribbon-helix-helix protein, CopG family [Acidobacteriota bacterium]
MRTTISVDDNLLAAARRQAGRRGQTLGRVIEDALRRELAAPALGDAPAVPVFRGSGGPRPGVDMRSNRALREELDRGTALRELR